MSITLIMSCYTGFFNVRRGWQSLNTGPRFYLRLIRRTGWLWIYTSRTTDGRPFKPKKLSVPFLYPGVPAGLTPFRGLVPLGWRNLVPILPPAHPLWGGVVEEAGVPREDFVSFRPQSIRPSTVFHNIIIIVFICLFFIFYIYILYILMKLPLWVQ
jgi:hypothetical protein